MPEKGQAEGKGIGHAGGKHASDLVQWLMAVRFDEGDVKDGISIAPLPGFAWPTSEPMADPIIRLTWRPEADQAFVGVTDRADRIGRACDLPESGAFAVIITLPRGLRASPKGGQMNAPMLDATPVARIYCRKHEGGNRRHRLGDTLRRVDVAGFARRPGAPGATSRIRRRGTLITIAALSEAHANWPGATVAEKAGAERVEAPAIRRLPADGVVMG